MLGTSGFSQTAQQNPFSMFAPSSQPVQVVPFSTFGTSTQPRQVTPAPAFMNVPQSRKSQVSKRAENTNVSPYNVGSIAVKGPPGVSLVSYERQSVKIKMIKYDKDGITIIYTMEHIISGDLKDTMDGFLIEFDKMVKMGFYPAEYSSIPMPERIRLRMFAMIPKIMADTSACWHIGEYIRRHYCVLRRDPLTGKDTPRLACMVVNYDTDTETFWFPDGMTFQGIPGTPYYSGNVFSFIKAEILNMMTTLAHFDLLKPEHKFLGHELMRLGHLYNEGLQNIEQVLECKRNIEEEFKKVGTFRFFYRKQGKANMFFESTNGIMSIELDDDSDEVTDINHGARRKTYLEIVRIIVMPQQLERANHIVNKRFDHFRGCTKMQLMFLPLSCLFREMFGMNDLFFENMRFSVLECVSKKNHDQLRDPRVNQLCPEQDTPIRNVGFFRVGVGEEGPMVTWIHSKNARSVARPGIKASTGEPCTAIANGLFPRVLQDANVGTHVPIETSHGVFSSFPSVKASTPKRVITSCYDGQRPIERVPTDQPFFHTPPIPNLMFSGTKRLGDGKLDKHGKLIDRSNVLYEVTYHGNPRLVIERDNQPLKTYGLVYFTTTGEVMQVEGNVSSKHGESSYFESLLLLIQMEKRSEAIIPELVTKCLDVVVEDRKTRQYTKSTLEDKVRKYITKKKGYDGSLPSLLKVLDTQFGDQYSSGVFESQIDDLKSRFPRVCRQMGPRQGSLGPLENDTPSPKQAEFRNVRLSDPVLSENNGENFPINVEFTQSEALSQETYDRLMNNIEQPSVPPSIPAPLFAVASEPAKQSSRKSKK